MEDKEKMPEVEIKTKNRFFTWLENYWYHYKWHTIIASVAVIIVIVCMWQVNTTKKHDVVIVYAGPNCLSVSEVQELGDAISAILPDDKDGNGEKSAAMNMYQIYSEEQIEKQNAETDATGQHMTVDTYRNTTQKTEYERNIMTGSSSIYFLDPWLYEEALELESEGRKYLRPLSEIFTDGNLPASRVDEYGVRLGDTDFYKDYAVVRRLSPDTVICLYNPLGGIGQKYDDKHYQYEEAVFYAILTYKSSSTSVSAE